MSATAPRRPPVPASHVEAKATDALAPEATPFDWTREQYDRIVDAGVLTSNDKVELIDGEVVAKMPQNKPHEITTGLVSDALREAFSTGSHVRDEKSVALSDNSQPEPDIAVVRGKRRDYMDRSPSPQDVLLLVEVADSSLSWDRTGKAVLYAEAGIVEYWIVNLRDRVLEVHRGPAGGVYQTKATLAVGGTVTPVRAPDAAVAVADLLP